MSETRELPSGPSERPVLILGAGINGCALARELLLNRVPVVVVDVADVASGATARSSRLIHGGLRYLEHGEFDLVRESLGERTRLLRLAPQFVQPLRLFIPIANRFGGVWQSAARFVGTKPRGAAKARGLWLVRLGLWLYDAYARDPSLPKHAVHRADDPQVIPVDSDRYRWLCSYYDAQVAFPERFVVALLEDARRLAEAHRVPLSVYTYHRATREGDTVSITPGVGAVNGDRAAPEAATIEPAAIVNATGAWVDDALERLQVPAPRLMGGTKGSHFFTRERRLVERLGGRAVYGEAEDGRPVFILPLAGGALVGTTDLPFEGDPAEAVATEEELEYLLRLVNAVMPGTALQRSDIDWHYSGVRPLPRTGDGAPASITRRHWMEEHDAGAVPMYSIIGGKLTTCRSLAEEAAGTILRRLGMPVRETSRERPLPGAEAYPPDAETLEREIAALAARHGWSTEAARAVWSLCGKAADAVPPPQAAEAPGAAGQCLAGTPLPTAFVRRVIEREWVRRLDDLVERRLMLLYHPQVNEASLRELAALLVEAGRLRAADVEEEVARVRRRLADHFGKRIDPS